MNEPITAREAEAYVPPLAMFAGNYRIKAKLLSWLQRPVEQDANLLIEGDPGTGKTSIVIAYLREQFKNPWFYREDFNEARKEAKERGETSKNLEDEREWQTSRSGKVLYFQQINGATDNEGQLRRKILAVMENFGDHSIALCDETGEIFFRGFDEMLRPMLTEAGITCYATAQNFHSKRKTDSTKEEDQRLSALLRRFTHREVTENPTDTDHVRLLAFLIKEWTLKLDSLTTLHRLVEKSKGIVGYSKRILVRAIDNGRRLTRDLVDDSDVDPLW